MTLLASLSTTEHENGVLGRVRNLSLSGALFEVRLWVTVVNPPPVDSPVVLDIRFPFRAKPCAFPGRVAHHAGTTDGGVQAIGIEFRELDASARSAIERVGNGS